MQYVPYRSRTNEKADDIFFEICRRRGVDAKREHKKLVKSKAACRCACREVSVSADHLTPQQLGRNQSILMSEFDWEDAGKPTYFVSARVVDLITNSKFSVCASDLTPRHRTAALSFPDTEVGLFSCLISVINGEERGVLFEKMCSAFDISPVPRLHKFHTLTSMKNLLASDVPVERKEVKKMIATSIDQAGQVVRLATMISLRSDIIDDIGCTEFTDYEYRITRAQASGNSILVNGKSVGTRLQDGRHLRDDEKRRLDQAIGMNTFLFALKLLAYIQSFPDSLVRGAPPHKMTQCKSPRESFMIDLPERFRNMPISHLRSGHFRALRDDRYKRNDDGSIRVIYVNPCIVGDIDPYHVDETPRTESGKPPI